MKRHKYIAPAIEVIDMEHEGVIAGSARVNGYDSGGPEIQLMQVPFDLAEFENTVNDLFTTIND